MQSPHPESASSEPEGFWSSLLSALRGSHRDFTQGDIGKAIALLAVPMVIEMSMESLFGLVDVFFVSRLGSTAVATVGLTEALLSILYTVAMGVAMAASSLVARRIGEKNPTEASRTAAQGLWLGVALALPIGLAGALFAPQLLRLMGADAAVLDTGTSFARLSLGGSLTVLLLFVLNGIFRGAGDAATAMRSLVLANSINIVLNPCLILGLGPFPRLGLLGSALATVLSRGVGVVYQLRILLSGDARIRLDREVARLDLPAVGRMLRVALGGMGQMLISTTSWIALVRIISSFGASALAGYTVAMRIIVVALLPAWGMSSAAATLVGQNLGARKTDRAEQSVWRAALYNLVFLAVVSVAFLTFAEQIVSPFVQDPEVLPYAGDCLRYVSYGYLFYAYGMVMLASFNGAGDTFTPTAINFGCFWLFQLPLAYVLSTTLGLGARGVFISITLSQSLSALVSVLIFRRGAWKTRQV